MAAELWEMKAAAKQKACFDKIPKEWRLPASMTEGLQTPFEQHPHRIIEMHVPRKSGIMSDEELRITEAYTVEELLKELREGSLTALAATVAFSKRAAIAQQLVSNSSGFPIFNSNLTRTLETS
jgi:amidase